MRTVILITLITISPFFILSSCRKPKETVEPQPNKNWLLLQIPYDTSNVVGVFVSDQDGSYAYFFGQYSSVVSAKISENGNYLSIGAGLYYRADSNPYDNIISEWNIMDAANAQFSFSYSDSSTLPIFSSINIPDTIVRSKGTSITVSTQYADTIVLITTIGSIVYDTRYYSAAIDSIKLDSTFFAGIQGNWVEFSLSAVTHLYSNINGFNYLFVKKQMYQKVFFYLKD